MIYCFDIDGTICEEGCRYEDAKPIKHRIKELNELYDSGDKIIFYTSRGYSSGKDWRELTETQLNEWGVKYHQLVSGKPFADVYVDSKAQEPNCILGVHF